jgi:hypothetical protein
MLYLAVNPQSNVPGGQEVEVNLGIHSNSHAPPKIHKQLDADNII